MQRFILIAVMVCIMIWYICDDYATYKRLNKVADDIISDVDMPFGDKLKNVLWLCRNCIIFSERSIFFKHHYRNIAVKLNQSSKR